MACDVLAGVMIPVLEKGHAGKSEKGGDLELNYRYIEQSVSCNNTQS